MIYAAFTIGLLGSLHCLGMCGPIAFALPVRTQNVGLKFMKYLLYNAGRIFTYASLGLMMGIAGKGFAMAGLQQMISIVSGILIIASVLLIHNPIQNAMSTKITLAVKEKLKGAFRFYFQDEHWYSLFILGVLNGLLPCGMVYAALFGALASGSYASGALFMAAFGLGTVPMMMLVSLSKNVFANRLKLFFNNVTPVMACIVGALLIMRGLNLDIPFISPSITGGEVHKCH